jgi:hypothetical protein
MYQHNQSNFLLPLWTLKFMWNLRFSQSSYEVFGEHPLSWTAVFEWHSCFKASRVWDEGDERSGWPSNRKWHKMLKKFENFLPKAAVEQCISLQILLESDMNLSGDLIIKFEHAPHCRKVCSPTLDKWSKATARKHVSWAMIMRTQL